MLVLCKYHNRPVVVGTEPQLSKQGYNGCNTTESREEEEIPIHKHDRAAGPAHYRCHQATTLHRI